DTSAGDFTIPDEARHGTARPTERRRGKYDVVPPTGSSLAPTVQRPDRADLPANAGPGRPAADRLPVGDAVPLREHRHDLSPARRGWAARGRGGANDLGGRAPAQRRPPSPRVPPPHRRLHPVLDRRLPGDAAEITLGPDARQLHRLLRA